MGRVRERMMEDVECSGPIPDLDAELHVLLAVGDGDEQVVIAGPPQQLHEDAVADAAMQLLCSCRG